MIERVFFKNFKSLREASVTLGRLMVIVGANGTGRTSILDGLHYLAQAARDAGEVRRMGVFGLLDLMSRDTAGPMELGLSGRFQGVDAGVEIVVTRGGEPSDTGFVPDWEANVVQRWGATRQVTKIIDRMGDVDSTPETIEGLADLLALGQVLGSVYKLRLDAERLAAPSYSEEESPRLGPHGEGLASVLDDLHGRAPETFQYMQDAARQVVPMLERIRTRRAKVTRREPQEIHINDSYLAPPVKRHYWGQRLVLDFKGAPDVPAPLTSEGGLLVIGILAALWTKARPPLLLLDDIDKALHPRAQGELIAQLRKVLAMDPELQIVATSNSPYQIDHFEPHEVLVTAIHPDGSTACAPLTEHPEFARWKSTTRTGEFWSFVGEDWVLERAHAGAQRR